MYFPLRDPNPDFGQLVRVLKGESAPTKVHLAEIAFDREIVESIYNMTTGEKLLYVEAEEAQKENLLRFKNGEIVVPLADEQERTYYKQLINFYYRMGYDHFPDSRPFRYLWAMIMPRVRSTRDTAALSKRGGYTDISMQEGNREWVEEGKGVIGSWEEFERFPWDRMRLDLGEHYKTLLETIPRGMKTVVTGSIFEQVLERLLGFEGLFFLLHDDPSLVKAVTDRWASVVYDYYSEVLRYEVVGGIFHGDDLGHVTGTLVSPSVLRELFFPHVAACARLAHEHGKVFWLHSCGNPLEIIEDLIGDVKIDAFHSFQDSIIPVTEFKKRFGARIATLGGVDMDKLVRLPEQELRLYVRRILESCVPGGRYALGSANTVANYVPVQNAFIMLDEGMHYGK